MRKELEQGLGPEFSRYLALLRSIRAEAMKSIDDSQRRRKLLLDIASQDIIRMLREKGYERTKRVLTSRLKRAKTG
jgi:siroheme synthase (precorrin-2 oxidase/ferrochelatase)